MPDEAELSFIPDNDTSNLRPLLLDIERMCDELLATDSTNVFLRNLSGKAQSARELAFGKSGFTSRDQSGYARLPINSMQSDSRMSGRMKVTKNRPGQRGGYVVDRSAVASDSEAIFGKSEDSKEIPFAIYSKRKAKRTGAD
jgi:hypothetical protein